MWYREQHASRQSQFERSLQILLVLNLLDAVFTSWWVGAGWATEANPFMAVVLSLGVMPFIAVKLATGAGVAVLLRGHGQHRVARLGVLVVLVVYATVVFLHLGEGVSRLSQGALFAVAG